MISPHHAFGNSIINSHLVSGSTVRIGNMNFIDSVFNLIRSDVSIFYGVPSTYRILLRYPDRFKKAFAGVRTAASAGGGMDRDIVKDIRGLAQIWRFYQCMGKLKLRQGLLPTSRRCG